MVLGNMIYRHVRIHKNEQNNHNFWLVRCIEVYRQQSLWDMTEVLIEMQ